MAWPARRGIASVPSPLVQTTAGIRPASPTAFHKACFDLFCPFPRRKLSLAKAYFCMEQTFDLPISYQGTSFDFSCTIKKMGYSYKIFIPINEVEVIFEPDEEGGYRALTGDPAAVPKVHLDPGLLQAIAEQLARFL